jgi:hypothetical protein
MGVADTVPEFPQSCHGIVDGRLIAIRAVWMVLISRSITLRRATSRKLSDSQNAADTESLWV